MKDRPGDVTTEPMEVVSGDREVRLSRGVCPE